jgi:hypothetical protein
MSKIPCKTLLYIRANTQNYKEVLPKLEKSLLQKFLTFDRWPPEGSMQAQ